MKLPKLSTAVASFLVLSGQAFADGKPEIFYPSGVDGENGDAVHRKIELSEREALDFQLRSPEQMQAQRELHNQMIRAIEELIEPARYGYKYSPWENVSERKNADTFEKFSERLSKVEALVLAGAGNERIWSLVKRLRDQINGAEIRRIPDEGFWRESDFYERQFYFGGRYLRNLAAMTALYYEAVAQKFVTNALSADAVQKLASANASNRGLDRKERDDARARAFEMKADSQLQLNRAYRAQLRAGEYDTWSQTVPKGSPPMPLKNESKDDFWPSVIFVGPVAGGAPSSVRVYDIPYTSTVVGPSEAIAAD